MSALYNEIDPFAAAWTRNLIAAGHIAPGVVDERSIEALTPADVAGPGQRHFFSGIAVWSYALRRAGVPDDADIWTGSCPCQPFSGAGTRSGERDPRHLWPAWFSLIEVCRPGIILAEQVASRDGLAWLDLVYADLERCGYTVGASDLCAAGIGAPHLRSRLYVVAYADTAGLFELAPTRWLHDYRPRRYHAHGRGYDGLVADAGSPGPQDGRHGRSTLDSGAVGSMGYAGSNRDLQHARELRGDEGEHDVGPANGDHAPIAPSAADDVADAVRAGRTERGAVAGDRSSAGGSGNGGVADTGRELGNTRRSGTRAQVSRRWSEDPANHQRYSGARLVADPAGIASNERLHGQPEGQAHQGRQPPGPRGKRDAEEGALDRGGPGRDLLQGPWDDCEWVLCRDPDGPRWRPVKPGTFPLAHGVAGRVGLLRAYGNGLTSEQAASFIRASLEAIQDQVQTQAKG